MTTFLFLLCWYLSGLVGSALFFEFWFRRNRTYPLDIEVSDLIVGGLLALLGPINLGVGIAFTIVWLLSPFVAKFKFNGDRVVFKRHEN